LLIAGILECADPPGRSDAESPYPQAIRNLIYEGKRKVNAGPAAFMSCKIKALPGNVRERTKRPPVEPLTSEREV
jgi:hypothetical protein